MKKLKKLLVGEIRTDRMPINSCLNNIRNFLNTPQKNKNEGMFRITVVAFEDRCSLNCGLRFSELIKQNNLFEVTFYNEPFPKGFLNLQGRNFFDLIDQGNRILETSHSDILIWGYEESGKIRLNFQVPNQYGIPGELTFSLLDSLFIPLSYFSAPNNFSESLLLLIFAIIIAAIKPVTNEQKLNKPKLLKDIIKLLSADTSPKDISVEFMPYIMNMLGKVYLSNAYDNLTNNDIEIIENLFMTALKNKQYMRLPIYQGCIYNNLGQLYEISFITSKKSRFDWLKSAIKFYREAQRFLSRNYPYDYGLTSYRLALLHFEFWKHTNDIQALRDAVAQLRESEKLYTYSQFPQSWCHVEGMLGYYLTCLGMTAQSNEIMHLAINSYHQQQKFFEQTRYPQQWADIQEEIGNIYYLLGKQNDDDNFMYEARNYFNSALDIYMQLKNKNKISEIKQLLAKVGNYIS